MERKTEEISNEETAPYFDVVVAMELGRGIGKEQSPPALPWPFLKGDTEFYTRLSHNPTVPGKKVVHIMGRKTFETTQPEFREKATIFNIVISRSINAAVGGKRGGTRKIYRGGQVDLFSRFAEAGSGFMYLRNALNKDWFPTPKNRECPQHAAGIVRSFDDALKLASSPHIRQEADDIWIMGGELVLKEALLSRWCRRVYLTRILAHYDSDAFMPPFEHEFQLINDPQVPQGTMEDNGVKYEFEVYERPKS